MKNRKCGSRVSLQEGASIHRMMWCIWCDTVLDSALKMMLIRSSNVKHKKGRYSSSWEPHLRATGRHLSYGITRCYLPPDTSERAPPNPSHAGWYSIYLPRRDGRLSWPSWLDSARPGVEPATFRSRVRRRTAAPPRQHYTRLPVTSRIYRETANLLQTK